MNLKKKKIVNRLFKSVINQFKGNKQSLDRLFHSEWEKFLKTGKFQRNTLNQKIFAKLFDWVFWAKEWPNNPDILKKIQLNYLTFWKSWWGIIKKNKFQLFFLLIKNPLQLQRAKSLVEFEKNEIFVKNIF